MDKRLPIRSPGVSS